MFFSLLKMMITDDISLVGSFNCTEPAAAKVPSPDEAIATELVVYSALRSGEQRRSDRLAFHTHLI